MSTGELGVRKIPKSLDLQEARNYRWAESVKSPSYSESLNQNDIK